MINSINFIELENIFLKDNKDTLIFAPIFNRRSGKTTNLIKLAKEYNAIYIGESAEICKIAQRFEPSIKALSPRQALNRDGLYEIDTVFIIDEVKEKEIKNLKKVFPYIRMFGLVNWEKSPNWMTLCVTEKLLDEDISKNKDGYMQRWFEESMESERGLNIIRGNY